LGGLAPLNSAAAAAALITTRDGIVGQWNQPTTGEPNNLQLETPDNMKRWEAWCRASVIDFELMSKLGFSRSATRCRSAISISAPIPWPTSR
jgi:hypothetical protein